MKININGTDYKAFESQTILDIARANDIFIPVLCYGDGLPPTGSCGICVVESEDGRLIRACAAAVRDGMKIVTDSPKVLAARKNLLELTLSAHTGDCVAPCKMACPAQTDCQGFISLIAAGDYSEAVELMKDAHPFPASVARICPRPCEAECRRKLADEPVNIAGIKRFAADAELGSKKIPQIAQATGRTVAIVGGGPAGLTAAFFLRKAGHSVAVFDVMPKMGGLLRYGIPEYRLPKTIIDSEIDVLTKMGIHFFNNMGLGRDITMSFLQSRYDAVIVATGAGVSKPIWCEGENAEGVFGGINFLKAVAENNPPVIGKRVVVIGGSNTAMDAARTAIRLGAEVIVAYRRTRDEMPAEKIEVEEALEEGVQFNFLTAPLEIISENGKVSGIRLQKMELGEPDESGRRRPVPVEGGEEFIEADTIIAAIGQDITLEGLNPLESLKVGDTFQTDLPNVYAIGDATGKSWYAIDAIGHGRKVAEIVHASFGKENNISEILPKILAFDKKTKEDFAETQKCARTNEKHTIKHGERPNFDAVQVGLTAEEVKNEAARCLSCGCADYFECKLVELANIYGVNTEKYPSQFHKKPKHKIDKSNFHFTRDMNKCVLCGLCVNVCGKSETKETLSAINRGFDTTIAAAFEQPLQNRDECTLCGNCVSRCPVGALTETTSQITVRENLTKTICTMCEKVCKIQMATKGNRVLRILSDENSFLCEKGRFGFKQLGDKLLTPLVKKEGLLRRATLQEAAKAVREGLNVIMAQYGAESIGISVSPTYVQEDILAIKKYADYIGTPNIFTLTDISEDKYCNTQGLKEIGITTGFEKINSGEIKALISFGDSLKAVENLSQFVVLHTAYASPSIKSADVVFPAPALGEVGGTVINNGIHEVLPAFKPLFDVKELIEHLIL